MKKLIPFLLAAAIFGACKKNSPGPTQIALSKIIENGKLEQENIFNGSGQLVEARYYKTEMGVTAVNYVDKYFYDKEGHLKESIGYSMPSNKVNTIGKFIVDGSGQLERQSYAFGAGDDSGEIYLHIDYKFKEGKIIKQTWRSTDEKITDYRDFTYYDNGNLKSVESYKVSGLSQEKFYSHSYSPSDATQPATLVRPTAVPVNYYLEYMVTGKVESRGYQDDVLDNHLEIYMSETQHDGRGFVTKHKMTTKKILPAGADEVTVVEYEWKKL
jgi:hypothetical protein